MSLGLTPLHTLNTIVANGLQISIKKNPQIYCVCIIHSKEIKAMFLEDRDKMQELLFKCSENNNNNSAIMLRPFTAGQVFIIKI